MSLKSFHVYESSAGSGKTYTLVKYYLKILLETEISAQSGYRNILAITFTNKATDEMKERIIQALWELKQGSQGTLSADLCNELHLRPEDLQKRASTAFTSILHNYSDFSIQTIDAFSFRIIRSMAHEFKIRQHVEPLIQTDTIKKQAVVWLLKEISKPQNFSLKNIVLDLMEQRMENMKNPDPRPELESMMSLLEKEDWIFHLDYLMHTNEETIRHALDISKQYLEIFNDELKKIHQRMVTLNEKIPVEYFFSKSKSPLLKIKEFDVGLLTELYQKLNEKESLEAFFQKTIIQKGLPPDVQQLLNILNEFKNYLDNELKKYYFHFYVLKNKNIYLLFQHLSWAYEEVKRKYNVIPVSEFNLKISSLIKELPVPYIYEKFGERYKHYLIDEFQDTAKLQWMNIYQLVENALSEGKLCMVVGDLKQSIYRWRNADPEIMMRLPQIPKDINEYQDNPSFKNMYEKYPLPINRRSRKNLVEFNNTTFKNFAEKSDNEFIKKIYSNVCQKFLQEKTGGYVEINLSADEKDFKNNFLEFVNYSIRKLLNSGYQYKDICVLLRKNSEIDEILDYMKLQHPDIPFSRPEPIPAMISPYISGFIWFLNYFAYGHEYYLNLWMKAFLDLGLIDDTFFQTLLVLDERARKKTIEEKYLASRRPHLSSMASLNNFIVCYTGFFSNEIRNDNRLFENVLIEIVTEFEQKDKNSNIFSFLQEWNNQLSEKNILLPADDNSVRIMTIHKSKGLQFKAVVIPGFISKKKKYSKELTWYASEAFTCNYPLKYVLLPRTKELDHSGIKENKDWDEVEELNVMYVAFTRAEDAMFIHTHTKDEYGKFIAEVFGISGGTKTWHSGTLCYFEDNKKQNRFPVFDWKEVNYTFDINQRIESRESLPIVFKYDFSPERERGEGLHRAISFYLEKKVRNGRLPEPDEMVSRFNVRLQDWEKFLDKLHKENVWLNFIQNAGHVWFEREFFDRQKGNFLRPDMVCIGNNEVWITDFKTGYAPEEQKEQLRRYMKLFKNDKTARITGSIFYISDDENIHLNE
ncbi:MAG: UvrD-helicase domain-containing protein [Bacteroidia bacterium]|nr:UvrD-helicase domain-containing protein [Bacteroidia bacterium]